MNYLLDVNVLLALVFSDHQDHHLANRWFGSLQPKQNVVLTTAITELGFVRVSLQAGLTKDLEESKLAFYQMRDSSPVPFRFLDDTLGVSRLPSYVRKPAQLTDGHLLELAKVHHARLTTLDKGIPGALLIR